MNEIVNINGATFIFSPFKGVETASLGVFICIGSRFEKKNLKGIAHFLEHMVFKGSKDYSHRKIKEEIEGRGGSLNAFTSHEITGYYAYFLNKNLPKTLDILLNMVFKPCLKAEDVSKERNVILEEIKMYNDLPSSRAVLLLDRLIWQGHPLGEEVIGYSSTVKKIKQKDLRDFRSFYYKNSNIVISFAGDYPKDKIIKLLKQRLQTDNKNIRQKTVKPKRFSGLHIETEIKPLEQSHLCIGFRGPSYKNPDRITARLLSVILGANMSSRLFEELREKKSLCYDISTEVRRYKDSGAFVIHIGLDKSKILVALSAIIRELNKIKIKEVPGKELSRAKDYLLGQIAMNLERPQGRMFHLAESYITLGKIDSFKEIKNKLENVTKQEIKRVAKDIFKFGNMCISCVGSIEKNLANSIKKTLKKGG